MVVDGLMLRDMILSGAALLEKNRADIDALNVFPVPDGDTGTNMSLTMMAAVRELNGKEIASVGEVAAALSRGSLRGARGNSGVILSQLWRGFGKTLENAETMDAKLFAEALKAGVATAYKAVIKPREGTILTVSKVVANEAEVAAKSGDIHAVLTAMMTSGERALRETPEQLPVLKQAGVVDAGGKGLLVLYAGFLAAWNGEEADISAFANIAPATAASAEVEDGDIRFAYCTEFVIQNCYDGVTEQTIDSLRDKLDALGDSTLVVGDPTFVKVHVHTNAPGRVLQLALRLGELAQIKIDNMRVQHEHLVLENNDPMTANKRKPEPGKGYGVLAVAAGEGMAAILKDLAVDVVVEGGQTMNPSVEDIADAIYRTGGQRVLVLPNNPNIIWAAQQAAAMITDREVSVVSTRSVPQGVAAMVAYLPDQPLAENASRMEAAAHSVVTGQVTYAVRDSKWNDKTIAEGDVLGLRDGKIVLVGSDVAKTALDLASEIINGEDCVVTLFYGEKVSREEAEQLRESLEAAHPGCDIDMLCGGQALYYYEFSVE